MYNFCNFVRRQVPYGPHTLASHSDVLFSGNISSKNTSYADLISNAIMCSPQKRLRLHEIYDWIEGNVPAFAKHHNGKDHKIGWKNIIRRTLSLHQRFIRQTELAKNGTVRDAYWTINRKYLQASAVISDRKWSTLRNFAKHHLTRLAQRKTRNVTVIDCATGSVSKQSEMINSGYPGTDIRFIEKIYLETYQLTCPYCAFTTAYNELFVKHPCRETVIKYVT